MLIGTSVYYHTCTCGDANTTQCRVCFGKMAADSPSSTWSAVAANRGPIWKLMIVFHLHLNEGGRMIYIISTTLNLPILSLGIRLPILCLRRYPSSIGRYYAIRTFFPLDSTAWTHPTSDATDVGSRARHELWFSMGNILLCGPELSVVSPAWPCGLMRWSQNWRGSYANIAHYKYHLVNHLLDNEVMGILVWTTC